MTRDDGNDVPWEDALRDLDDQEVDRLMGPPTTGQVQSAPIASDVRPDADTPTPAGRDDIGST